MTDNTLVTMPKVMEQCEESTGPEMDHMAHSCSIYPPSQLSSCVRTLVFVGEREMLCIGTSRIFFTTVKVQHVDEKHELKCALPSVSSFTLL